MNNVLTNNKIFFYNYTNSIKNYYLNGNIGNDFNNFEPGRFVI